MWPSYRPRRSWAFHPLSVLLLASFAAAVVLDKIEGLDVAITRIGDCTHKAQEGDKIWMHYRGTLQSNGIEFDSSYAGGHPFAFHLGQEEVIKGWDLGLEDICLGEARKLIIPAELAYGDAGSPPKIPGGAILGKATKHIQQRSRSDNSLDSLHDGMCRHQHIPRAQCFQTGHKDNNSNAVARRSTAIHNNI